MRAVIVIAAMGGLLASCGGSTAGVQAAPTASASTTSVAASTTAATLVALPDNDREAPIVSAVEAVGGATMDEQQWAERFPAQRSSVPTLDAELIEAATDFSGGRHIEERSWLVVDPRNRYDLVEDMKTAIGPLNVDTATNTNDDESMCSETIGTDDDGVKWTVRACDYPSLADTHAVGIVQDTSGTDSFTVDDTMSKVLELTGGTVTDVSARLRVPQPGQESLVRSARIELAEGVNLPKLVQDLKSGPLVEYGMVSTDESAVFTGPRGETWTITSSVAMFESQGPW